MPRFDDEFPEPEPLRPTGRAHQIGEPLDLLSIQEIDERIAILRAEINRLEAQRANKEASRRSADAFFKR